jgi:hypothetical protein
MRAVQFEQSHSAALIAKYNEVLSQDLDPMRQVAQLVGEADRLPETAEIFAAGCARADMGELGVLLRNLTVKVSAISRLQDGALVTTVVLHSMISPGGWRSVAPRSRIRQKPRGSTAKSRLLGAPCRRHCTPAWEVRAMGVDDAADTNCHLAI